MNKSTRTSPSVRLLVAAGLTTVLMLVAACASTPPAPVAALDAAKVAILNAEKADAGHFAGDELGEARQKLAAADTAVLVKEMMQAERLAQQSRVQAELASARTEAAKAAAVNKEMERAAVALTEEMQRAGDTQ